MTAKPHLAQPRRSQGARSARLPARRRRRARAPHRGSPGRRYRFRLPTRSHHLPRRKARTALPGGPIRHPHTVRAAAVATVIILLGLVTARCATPSTATLLTHTSVHPSTAPVQRATKAWSPRALPPHLRHPDDPALANPTLANPTLNNPAALNNPALANPTPDNRAQDTSRAGKPLSARSRTSPPHLTAAVRGATGTARPLLALATTSHPSWGWPLPGRPAIVRPFDPPDAPWGRGHRGVDLAAPAGSPVLAAGPGVVTYAAVLAGRGVVTVTHLGGLRTTYEPVSATVRPGQPVSTGDVLGTLQAGHPGCPRPSCLHWGLRRGDTYLDPMILLATGPIRLLPLTDPPGPARPAHEPSAAAATITPLPREGSRPIGSVGLTATAIGTALAAAAAGSHRHATSRTSRTARP